MRVPADAVDALRRASGSGGYFLSVPNFADTAPCRSSIQLTVDFKLASSLAGELRLPLRFYRHSRKLGIVCLKTDEDYVRSKLGENALPPPPEGLKFCLRSRAIDAMSSLEVVQVCAHQGWEINVVARYRSRKELPKMIVVAKEKPKSNFIILRDDMITIKEVGLGKQNPDKMDLDEFPHLCQPNAAPSVGIDYHHRLFLSKISKISNICRRYNRTNSSCPYRLRSTTVNNPTFLNWYRRLLN